MNLTTPVGIIKTNHCIDFSSRIITIGSCFADTIGAKFKHYQFVVHPNPFGVIFNPKSIEKVLQRAVSSHYFTEQDLVFHQDLWHSFDVHSDFSSTDKHLILNNLNEALRDFVVKLKAATHLYITYGTSWVYVLKSNHEVVSNCHKFPQNQFEKRLLSVTEIETSIATTMELVQQINPNCRLIFTVSPVRHIKDGFVENQRSKSHLIAAIHNCISSPDAYFPSFEIMMDELRDYRFYASDMLHPSAQAIDYIWEKFIATSIEERLVPTLNEIDSIQKSLAHRAFNPNTANHQKFLQNLNDKIIQLQKKHPQIQFDLQ